MIQPIGKWKQIFAPSENSKYVNDHTVFLDKEGNYRLIGTTSNKGYAFFRERFFVEAISEKIDGKYRENDVMFENNPHHGIKISPFVIFSETENKFHLFFGPGKISHYVSDDGIDWNYSGVAVKTIWPLTRDPQVIVNKDEYLMYLTGSSNRVIAYKSSDLYSWKFVGSVFKLGAGAPRSANSACESPTVIEYKKKFYLFTTITPALIGSKEHYNNTIIFHSDNPLDFGTYSKKDDCCDNVAGSIEAHAPEVFLSGNKILYTTCGWSHMPKPDGITDNGVYMRELKID